MEKKPRLRLATREFQATSDDGTVQNPYTSEILYVKQKPTDKGEKVKLEDFRPTGVRLSQLEKLIVEQFPMVYSERFLPAPHMAYYDLERGVWVEDSFESKVKMYARNLVHEELKKGSAKYRDYAVDLLKGHERTELYKAVLLNPNVNRDEVFSKDRWTDEGTMAMSPFNYQNPHLVYFKNFAFNMKSGKPQPKDPTDMVSIYYNYDLPYDAKKLAEINKKIKSDIYEKYKKIAGEMKETTQAEYHEQVDTKFRKEAEEEYEKSKLSAPEYKAPEATLQWFADLFGGKEYDHHIAETVNSYVRYIGFTPYRSFGRSQVFAYYQGSGGNGKSTLSKYLRTFAGGGESNAVAIPIEELSNANDKFATADAAGKMMLVSNETSSGYLESLEALKGLTGGDPWRAQRKNQDAFQFENFAKPHIFGNSALRASDTSRGIVRRLLLFDMPVVIDGNREFQKKHDLKTIYKEGPQMMLYAMLLYKRDVLDSGMNHFPRSKTLVERVNKWRSHNNLVTAVFTEGIGYSPEFAKKKIGESKRVVAAVVRLYNEHISGKSHLRDDSVFEQLGTLLSETHGLPPKSIPEGRTRNGGKQKQVTRLYGVYFAPSFLEELGLLLDLEVGYLTGESLKDRPYFAEQGAFVSKDARIVKDTGLVSDVPEFRNHLIAVEKERGRYSGAVDTSKADSWKHEAFREDLVKYLGGMSNAELLAYLSDLGIYEAPNIEQGTLLGGDDDE